MQYRNAMMVAKDNRSTTPSAKGKKGKKRNGAAMASGSKLSQVAKGFAIVLAAAVVATGVMLLASMQSLGLGAMAQAGILIATGLVIVGAGVAMGHPYIGIAGGAALSSIGASYLALSWGSRSADLVNRVQQLVGSTPASAATATAAAAATPAAAAATNPAAWVASTPAWPAHGLPRSVGVTDFTNVTSMPYAGVSGGYG